MIGQPKCRQLLVMIWGKLDAAPIKCRKSTILIKTLILSENANFRVCEIVSMCQDTSGNGNHKERELMCTAFTLTLLQKMCYFHIALIDRAAAVSWLELLTQHSVFSTSVFFCLLFPII